jgi:hypothetical protein
MAIFYLFFADFANFDISDRAIASRNTKNHLSKQQYFGQF